MMNIRPIRNESDLDWALNEVEAYFDNPPEPGSPEGDRFSVLADLIENYERKHYPLPAVDPIDTIIHTMEMTGRTQADLGMLLGSRPRASEVLNRKRGLTVEMIDKLHTEWSIPADVLVRPYAKASEEAVPSKPMGKYAVTIERPESYGLHQRRAKKSFAVGDSAPNKKTVRLTRKDT